ncbi:hybrid sensor histidine kinase/response regulator [Robiginitalea sp. SC105]|uniref:hybrid sensor histidine kinase/response regulator n=1 Tax=Robiginitalea sp. SC105 TaxID=2762332 RepID=UPI00163A226D|nr:hybrid sensor histidine kinase/response regulator [Robiginitalea sp. SC105]MBC2840266.1 response regulator [Robiginitalea sp. SC105]
MSKALTIFLFFATGLLFSQTPYDPAGSDEPLYRYAEWAPAGKQSLPLSSVQQEGALDFRPMDSGNQALGFTSDYHWLRFKLVNPGPQPATYYLQTARPVTDQATLYRITGTEAARFQSGDRIPFADRQVPHRATVFRLDLPPESQVSYYLEFKSDGETLNLPLDLYTETGFWEYNYGNQLFLGFFYGILLLAGIIYLFFYRSLMEKSFLYYGIYVLSIFLMQATLDGLVFQYAFPEGGYLNNRFVLISALICNFYLLKYCEHFLRIAERNPPLGRAYLFLYLVIGVLVAATMFGPELPAWVYPVSNLNGLLSLLLILYSLLSLKFRNRVVVDPYFTIGICFLVIGLLGFVLNNLSVLPNNFLTLNAAKFGSGLEVIFLSLSMTNLIRELRLKNERAQELALQKSVEISQMKSSFMSNMSHELRTPLNLIMGIVQEGMNADKDEAYRRELSMIRDASISLLSNINDILDFEKLESGTLTLREDRFAPAEELYKLSSHWQEQALEKGLRYHFEVLPGLPGSVVADKERLLQVVNNVLSNAVKFTMKGRIEVVVSSQRKEEGKQRIVITVRDTGIGIPAGKMPHIFDSFNQMRLNDKRNFGGVGMGLCIARHLTDAFGGSLEMQSEEGQGTEVVIAIPVKALAVGEPGSSSKDTAPVPLAGMRVLVVEDNKMNQLVIKKLLGKIPGVTASFAGNGKECLTALRSDPFDLVLMDLQMPVMDGYEATRAIRSGTLGMEIGTLPIIAVTADTTEGARQRVIEVGMQDYISKPVDLAVLTEKLEYYGERRRLAS